MSHACYECAHAGRGFPCRVDGRADHQVIARHYVAHMDPETGSVVDDDEASWWSWECIEAAVREDPDLAWQVIHDCLPLLTTEPQAGLLAAGHLEDLVRSHGHTLIDRIEAEWRRSPRFRFVLAGVWFRSLLPDDSLRRRIADLQAAGPSMNHGDPLPPP